MSDDFIILFIFLTVLIGISAIVLEKYLEGLIGELALGFSFIILYFLLDMNKKEKVLEKGKCEEI